MHKLLIVDDEKNTREGLERALKFDYQVSLAESAEQALTLLANQDFDLVLTDVKMTGMDGITFVKELHERGHNAVCVVMTAFGSIDAAVDAMKVGAYDFLTKPLDLSKLDSTLNAAAESKMRRDELKKNTPIEEPAETLKLKVPKAKKKSKTTSNSHAFENVIGQSEKMTELLETVKLVAPARSTVLLSGENGTGKEVIAQAIHRVSDRVQQPFVAIHCAALNANLLESELFGHEKGAFTGATTSREGRFEQADGGTLFLDEIGEIDPATQVKLLRVLESRSFERVGGTKTIKIDVRLIAATNRNLKEMVKEGTFREDLFFRLNVIDLCLPALRERRDDIPLLLDYYLAKSNEENGRNITGFSADALEAMQAYSWPGNVRELRNIVERLSVLCRHDEVQFSDLPSEFKDSANQVSSSSAPATASSGLDVKANERDLIIRALKETNNNKTKAAEILGISRRTLHRKIDSLKIEL